MGNTEKKWTAWDKLKKSPETVWYYLNGVLFLMLFFKPMIFVTGISLQIVIAGLACPIWLTNQLYTGSMISTRRVLVATALVSTLVFGSLLPTIGTVSVPGLLHVVEPMVCPPGFDVIKSTLEVQQYEMYGTVSSFMPGAVCAGMFGKYEIGQPSLIASGFIMYLLYGGLYFAVVFAVRKQKLLALKPYAAQGIILVLFIVLLFVTMLNPPVRAAVSRPVNDLVNWGHPASLVEAVKLHKIELIKQLLGRGGDINAKRYRKSALDVAQEYKDKEVLDLFASRIVGKSGSRKALLDKGIVYDETNFFKRVSENDIENVKLFLDSGMNIDAVSSAKGWYEQTVLAVAAEKGHQELVQLLLDRKAGVNKRGALGTALHAAAQRTWNGDNELPCRDDIVRLLIRNGADVNAKDKFGATALMKASETACYAAARTLVENKADVNVPTEDGHTALMYAVDHPRYHEEPDPKAKNYKIKVLDQESYDLVKYLLDQGADPNVRLYSTEDSPLRIAKRREMKEVVRLLEERHARD